MRKIIYIFIVALSFTSCQDVIEVDLETTEPRLVIDAALNWVKNTSGNIQTIKLSLSAPFYNSEIPPATGASVVVTDTFNNTYNFIEQEETGVYINNTFVPAINGVYNLTVTYNNETYTATEQLMPVSNIDSVIQNSDGGFSGDEIEIEAYYTDPGSIDNYYLFEFINNAHGVKSLEVYDDEFTDGNEIFAFYSDENIEVGDELVIRNLGISERFYEFMNILLQQTDDDSGDPFETQPALVRGNCVNVTNPENYPLGYFRASEVSIFTYIVE